METLLLVISIGFLVAALRSHAMAQANVKTVIDRIWYERLFTGSRASKDNLTESGLHYRKQSNLYAICGFFVIALYVWLRFTS